MAFNKNKVMDSARKYVERGQIDKAVKEYLRIVREDPKDVRVWLKIGDLYARKGDKAEATDTYLKVARFYSEQGFYLKAVAVYKQILKLDPRLVEVNLKLAELYRQLGLLSDAMQHFEMVAGHFHREGKTKEALATVRQLVDLDPDNVATRIKLAELYSKEGMIEQAVAEFAQACEFLRSNNRQDDFLKVAERLLWHKPDNIELNRELATIYLRRNDPRRALQKLQVCFKADSRDVETLALLAQAFQALDQKSKTVSVLKELARVLDENGQRARAGEVHRKILEYVPEDPDSRTYLGATGVPAPAPAPPPPPAPVIPEPPQVPAVGSSASETPGRALSIESEIPLRPKSARMTGSVPLLSAAQAAGLLGLDNQITEDPDSIVEDFVLDDDSGYETSYAGEAHEEEIVKILTETDVYVKYGLHQKAVEHLRRIFELDPNNVEARERLKEIYLTQGRENEAIEELEQLAELTASYDPVLAEGYLREVLGIDASRREVYEIAQRYRLDLSGGPELEIIDDVSGEPVSRHQTSGGTVVPVDDDLDFAEIEFDEEDNLTPNAPTAGVSSTYQSAFDAVDSLEYEFQDQEPTKPPPADPSSVTMEVDVHQVEAMVELADDDDDGDELEFSYTPGGYEDSMVDTPVYQDDYDPTFGGTPVMEAPPIDPADVAAFEAAPISDPLGPDPRTFDAEPLANLGDYATDFDPGATTGEARLPFEEYSDISATDFSGIPGATGEAVPTVETRRPGIETVDTAYEVIAEDEYPAAGQPYTDGAGSEIEDDLDEADFFASQGLFSEARDIVKTLLARHPNHPLLLAKLREIDELEGVGPIHQPMVAHYEQPPGHNAPEHLDPHALDAVDATIDTPLDTLTSEARPTVLLEKPVDDSDAETHYDLGLAYKEMGLHDEAIKAFLKVAEVPGREVQCRLMIGLCHRERGNYSEGIHQFKTALHVPGILDREKLSLYYEIGAAYEALSDPREALYFYEMVSKKDPRYRDIADRVATIERALGRNTGTDTRRTKAASDDPDSILDTLLAESDHHNH